MAAAPAPNPRSQLLATPLAPLRPVDQGTVAATHAAFDLFMAPRPGDDRVAAIGLTLGQRMGPCRRRGRLLDDHGHRHGPGAVRRGRPHRPVDRAPQAPGRDAGRGGDGEIETPGAVERSFGPREARVQAEAHREEHHLRPGGAFVPGPRQDDGGLGTGAFARREAAKVPLDLGAEVALVQLVQRFGGGLGGVPEMEERLLHVEVTLGRRVLPGFDRVPGGAPLGLVREEVVPELERPAEECFVHVHEPGEVPRPQAPRPVEAARR